jgi:arylformamidase
MDGGARGPALWVVPCDTSEIMRFEDYPPQEPPSDNGRIYGDKVMQLGAGLEGNERRYGEDAYQSLAIFRAPAGNGTLLAVMHGGGWTNGYKEWMAFMAPALTAAGVSFATIGYRLAPAHLFPAGIDDAIAALAWLHANAATFDYDPTRIFLGGHSAGGHYAALLAVRRDWQAGAGLPGDVVRGCLPISGVYDFGAQSGLSAWPRFLGAVGNEKLASPIDRIEGKPPPFLIAHGDEDFPHLIKQAERMEAVLRAAGGDVERVVLKGRNHFTASYAGGEPAGPWVPRALDWMERMSKTC